MQSKQEKLNQLKNKIKTGSKQGNFDTAIYSLMTELGSVGDFIGREYRFEYDEQGKIIGMIQLPIKIPSLLGLFREAEKRQKEMDKQSKKGKKR